MTWLAHIHVPVHNAKGFCMVLTMAQGCQEDLSSELLLNKVGIHTEYRHLMHYLVSMQEAMSRQETCVDVSEPN